MTNYTGNAIPAPGYNRGSGTVDDELLYSHNAWSQKGVTLKPGQGVLKLGTLLKQDSATKLYIKATDSTAEGVLRQTVDTGTDANGHKWLGNIVIFGTLKLEKVKDANSGVVLNTVLNSTVNEVMGFFKF